MMKWVELLYFGCRFVSKIFKKKKNNLKYFTRWFVGGQGHERSVLESLLHPSAKV